MKSLLSTAGILLLGSLSFAQTAPTRTITAFGGYETHAGSVESFFNSSVNAWNTGVQLNTAFRNSDRWHYVFGASTGAVEYNNRNDVKVEDFDTLSMLYPTYGWYNAEGYYVYEPVYYARTLFLRLQTGVGYRLVNRQRWTLTTGVNAVVGVELAHRERGKGVKIPAYKYPELNVVYYDFDRTEGEKSPRSERLALYLQPHVAVACRVAERWQVAANIGYMQRVFTNYRLDYEAVIQCNVGAAYAF